MLEKTNHEPRTGSLEQYDKFLHELADKEMAATHQKFSEHGVFSSSEFGLLERSANIAGLSIEEVFWSYAARHIGALLEHKHLSQSDLRKRLMDLYGYVCLGIALIDSELLPGSPPPHGGE